VALSGEKARAGTRKGWSASRCRSFPVASSHTRICLSTPAEASSLPSGEQLRADGVGQHEVAGRQAQPIIVPEEIPVSRQADNRHRRRPEAPGNRRIPEKENDEIGLPAGGKARCDLLPRFTGLNHQVQSRLATEGEAAAGLPLGKQVLL